MTVRTVGFPYAADRFGGSTASSLVLARALQEEGHRIQILVHGGEGRVADEATALGLAVTRLPRLSAIAGYARPDRFRLGQILVFRDAVRAIQDLSLDIVHTNDLAMLRSWAMPSLTAGAALVAHWRSTYRESLSVRAALRVAGRVIAVSHYSLARLPDSVRRKTVVEYNALALTVAPEQKAAYRARLRARFGLPADAALIGVFGNHIRRKRTHVLADLLAAMPRTADGRPVYGLACGERAEPYDTRLDEKIALFGLGSRLLRPGFVRPVEDWMSACDLVIAPAVAEPLARNVLEALALGVPVVASTDGGLKELIRHGDNGLLCDPADMPAWIAASRRLLDDAAFAAALARKGRLTAAELSPARHAARVSAIYRELFARGKEAA